jgi:hypothetical protein
VTAIGRKRKPRGRAFEKGNKLGNRFAPGESGNPAGSTSEIQQARRILERAAVDAAERKVKQMESGDGGATTEILDRTLGKPKQSTEFIGTVEVKDGGRARLAAILARFPKPG